MSAVMGFGEAIVIIYNFDYRRRGADTAFSLTICLPLPFCQNHEKFNYQVLHLYTLVHSEDRKKKQKQKQKQKTKKKKKQPKKTTTKKQKKKNSKPRLQYYKSDDHPIFNRPMCH